MINLTFQDIHNSKQELHWFNKDNNVNYDLNQISRFIKDQVNRAIKLLHGNFGVENHIFNIKIIQDPSRIHGNTLAYFNAELSTRYDSMFFCYWKYAIIEYHQNTTNAKSDIKNVWIHELAHCFDFVEIHRMYETLKKIKSDYTHTHIVRHQVRYLYLKLMSNLKKVRAEGIATFIEDLFDNGDNEIWEKEFIVNVYFQNFTKILEFDEDNLKSIGQYHFGKHLILNVLFYKHQEYDHIFKSVAHKIRTSENISISDFVGMDILPCIYNIKIEEILFIHLQKKTPLLFEISLQETILQHLLEIAESDNIIMLESETQFIDDLFKLDEWNDNKKIRFFEDSVGYPMKNEEIESHYIAFKAQFLNHNVFIELLSKAYSNWEATHDELLAWKLSYVFDKEDLIPDDLYIVGIIDDMLVLDS